jgi:hypothetical protein
MIEVGYIPQFCLYAIYSLGPSAISCVNSVETCTSVYNLYVHYHSCVLKRGIIQSRLSSVGFWQVNFQSHLQVQSSQPLELCMVAVNGTAKYLLILINPAAFALD